MHQYTVFVCDICGFESKDQHFLLQHEAEHYNLTVNEYDGYKHMIAFAKFCSNYALDQNVSVGRRQGYKEQYKICVEKIRQFEQAHPKLSPTEWEDI